ncbi:hypothetical protein RF11_01991 [Thelohanellus kitauei]|uniref:Uncharacterized protein n=1 Tax=Thelohanellus kitauei TaxID=669202 RepID=A0A0C2MV09_THEKT|nr:hypothetical protein RF11_01991 [Thelohanellus kitauei]
MSTASVYYVLKSFFPDNSNSYIYEVKEARCLKRVEKREIFEFFESSVKEMYASKVTIRISHIRTCLGMIDSLEMIISIITVSVAKRLVAFVSFDIEKYETLDIIYM